MKITGGAIPVVGLGAGTDLLGVGRSGASSPHVVAVS